MKQNAQEYAVREWVRTVGSVAHARAALWQIVDEIREDPRWDASPRMRSALADVHARLLALRRAGWEADAAFEATQPNRAELADWIAPLDPESHARLMVAAKSGGVELRKAVRAVSVTVVLAARRDAVAMQGFAVPPRSGR